MNDIKLVDSAISQLLNLKTDTRLNSSMRDQIDLLLSEFRFLQLYLQCIAKWNEALQGKKNRQLGAAKKPHIKDTLVGTTNALYTTGITALATQDFRYWDNLVSELLQRIQSSKPKIKDDSHDMLYCTSHCRFSNSELQKFFSNLSNSLDEIIQLKSEKIVDIKIQIQGIKEKLHFFAKVIELSRKMRSSNKDLKDFNVRIQVWAHKAACLLLLCRVQNEKREDMPIFLLNPEVTKLFVAVLKHLWSLSHNRLLMDEGVPKFVDFLLEILQPFSFKDDIENLRRNLIFLTTYSINPPMAENYREDAESIAKEVESLICSLNHNVIQEGIAKDFHEMVDVVKGKVIELYACIFLDSTSFDFPRINVSGYIDSLIDNLREISQSVSNPHLDYRMLEEDLLSLRSFLNYISEKNMDIDEELQRRIINLVYRVEIVVNMSSYLNDRVLYNLKFISDVREEISLIKIDIEGIRSLQFGNMRVPNKELVLTSTLSSQANLSIREEEVVGFKDDLDVIVGELLCRIKQLKMILIAGAAGQGKTTLAKMVLSHHSVKYRFDMMVWCVVSPTFQRKRILLDILKGLHIYHDVSNAAEEDLGHMLYRALKKRRYLVIMDDVWQSSAFESLRISFPNDENGSRILLTTRNHDLVHGISNSMPKSVHTLGPLSPSESLELFRKRLFPKGRTPNSNFVKFGHQIVSNCNWIPLSIIIIAGLLSLEVDNLDWWIQMAEPQMIDSQIASSGVLESVELSYKHLPEHLKPCFLYFGAFQAENVIRARRLIQLWVSEGLIQKSAGKFPEDVAMEYLEDLVSRSLVDVTNRSSLGEIKTCQIRGVFFEFCLSKVKEEKFLHVQSGDDLSFKSMGRVYKNYRLCIQSGGDGFFASNPFGPCVHSLLFVPDYTSLNKGDLFSICNFNLLHILDLEDMEFKSHFPEEVTLLFLLRYLAVWCPSGIFSIPPSISNLGHLETFRVKRVVGTRSEISLPDSLWKMKRLRHVDVGGFTTSFLCDSEPNEESLALDNIQTFSAPSLSHREDAEKLLRRLSKVRKLKCQFNESCDPYQNGFPAFGVLRELESLNARYFGSLFYPAGGFYLPRTLRKLTLAHFMIPWSEMSGIVRNLHNLEVLKLLKNAFVGDDWFVTEEDFPNLKFLKLCELDIAQWIVSGDAFCCLKQLIVENCYELKEIPLEFGTLLNLEKIQVQGCRPTVANSAWELKEEQHEQGNAKIEIHVSNILKPL